MIADIVDVAWRVAVALEHAGVPYYVGGSVEDSILKKLQWYLLGDRVSSTQWRDVVELIRVNGSTLDRAYLERWAPELGVTDDLARASAEAEKPPG